MSHPKDVRGNDIPYDARHFIRTEIDSTDLKKSNLISKISSKKTKNRKKPYFAKMEEPAEVHENSDTTDTIETLEDIANLQPGKNAQLAAKKISKKY